MKEPKRLLHTDREFARLVAASEADEPPADRFEKAMSLMTAPLTSSRWAALRWVAPCLAVGSALVVASALGTRLTSTAPAAMSAPTALVAPAESITAPSIRTVSVEDLAEAPAPPATVGPREAALSRRNAPGVSTNPAGERGGLRDRGERGTTFREELKLVSKARSSLEARDIPACLRAIEQYDARFPSGVFAQEIRVLDIEALAASGERARARAEATHFLAANTDSPYTDRVRTLLLRTEERK